MKVIKNAMLLLLYGMEINFASRYVFDNNTSCVVSVVLSIVLAIVLTFIDWAWKTMEPVMHKKYISEVDHAD